MPIRAIVMRREPATSRRLLAQNAPERGILVLTATPANEGLAPITRALLEAMGKDPQLTGGATCSARYGWPLLAPWLLALGIREVVVDESQLLRPKVLEELIVLLIGLGVRLWLVGHRPLGDAYPALLAAWPVAETSWEALTSVLDGRQSPSLPPTAAADACFPAVPDSEFLFFRADCRDLLDANDFAIVDTRYLVAIEEMRAWVHAAPKPIHAEHVARMLRAVLPDCSGPDEMLTVLRASAAVLLFKRVLIRCGAADFRAAVVDQDWFLTRHRPDWALLAGYRQPYRAATCAVVAAGLSLEQAVALTLGDVALHGDSIVTSSGLVSVDPCGRPSVRAQRLARTEAGAAQDDPFFVTAEGAPATVRYLREALTEPSIEAGAELTTGRVSRRRPTPAQWAARLHLRIRCLP